MTSGRFTTVIEDDITAVHQSLQGKDNMAVYGESLEDVHGIFLSVED